MITYHCDLCGEKLALPFREKKYHLTKNPKGGTMLMVRVETQQGDLCEACARKIAHEGRPS